MSDTCMVCGREGCLKPFSTPETCYRIGYEKAVAMLLQYETQLKDARDRALKAQETLKRALYEEGYCEMTTADELAGPPNGHAPGCYTGVNTGCNCWVGRARYLAPEPRP